MPASVHYDNMDLVNSPLEQGVLVSRSINISSVDIDSVFHMMESPRTIWSSPNQPFSISFGSAITLSASGDSRFEQIMNNATLSLSNTDIDTIGSKIFPLKF